LAVTIAPPQPLLQQVEELLELIGWCGIFELELLELGENRFGAIDFNPRPFGWMALSIAAGANLPALWCDYVLQRRGFLQTERVSVFTTTGRTPTSGTPWRSCAAAISAPPPRYSDRAGGSPTRTSGSTTQGRWSLGCSQKRRR
jgi:hypothetical protein